MHFEEIGFVDGLMKIIFLKTHCTHNLGAPEPKI